MFDWLFGKQKLRENTVKLIALCDELYVRTGGKYSSRLSGMAWKMISDCGHQSMNKACPDLAKKIKALETMGDAIDLYITVNEVQEDRLRIAVGVGSASWQALRSKKFKSYNKETGLVS